MLDWVLFIVLTLVKVVAGVIGTAFTVLAAVECQRSYENPKLRHAVRRITAKNLYLVSWAELTFFLWTQYTACSGSGSGFFAASKCAVMSLCTTSTDQFVAFGLWSACLIVGPFILAGFVSSFSHSRSLAAFFFILFRLGLYYMLSTTSLAVLDAVFPGFYAQFTYLNLATLLVGLYVRDE